MRVKSDTSDTKLAKKYKKSFLLELQKPEVCGNVRLACKRVALSHQTVYRWKQKDKQFSDAWDSAVWIGRQTLVDMADTALYRSVLAGNTTAIIFTLKKLRPEIYNRG